MLETLVEFWSLLKKYFVHTTVFCVLIAGLKFIFGRYFYAVSYIPIDFVLSVILMGCAYSFLENSEKSGHKKVSYFAKGFDKILSLVNIAVTFIILEKVSNYFLQILSPEVNLVRFTDQVSYVGEYYLMIFFGEFNTTRMILIVVALPFLLTLTIAIITVVTKQMKFIQSMVYSLNVVYYSAIDVLVGFFLFQILHVFTYHFIEWGSIYYVLISSVIFSLQLLYFYTVYVVRGRKFEVESEDDLLSQFGR